MKILFVLSISLSIFAGNVEEKLTVKFSELLRSKGIPGGVLAVIDKHGSNVIASGYADLKKKVKMTEHHQMFGGETGKIITGLVAAKLIGEGKLKLDAPVKAYLGDAYWFHFLPRADEITVSDLIFHRTGYPDYKDSNSFIAAFKSITKNKKRLKKVTIPPEKMLLPLYNYKASEEEKKSFIQSSLNDFLLGLVMEKILRGKVSKFSRSFYKSSKVFKYAEKEILKKSKLVHTTRITKAKMKNMSGAYTDKGNSLGLPEILTTSKRRITPLLKPEWEYTSGGYVTSAKELALLMHKAMNGELFKKSYLKDFLRAEKVTDDFSIGHGFKMLHTKDGDVLTQHGKSFGYASSVWYFLDQKVTMAIQINHDGKDIEAITREMASAFLR